MRKSSVIVLMFFCLSCLVAEASSETRQYRKYIRELDVMREVKGLPSNSPTLFWSTLIETNRPLKKFQKDLKKNQGAEKEAITKVTEMPKFYPKYDRTIIEELQGFCDTVLIHMGISDLDVACSLHVVYSDEVNAFTALTEDGFAMCVTSGMFSRKGLSYEMLLGFVAHEFVHGVLRHHIRGFYAEAKKRRKDELWGGIAKGIQGLAAGAQVYSACTYGIQSSYIDLETEFNKIDYEVKMSTLKYGFKFSREQEFECDLIAYRFLENLGVADEYIEGLRMLGSEYDSYYDEYSDHPTISSRVEFLKFVKEHPKLGNEDDVDR